jgi:ribosomal protein L7/L12
MSIEEDRLIADLHQRIRVLAAGLGVAATFEVPPDVRRLAKEGETVRAVKELRRATSFQLGLVAAKRMVDALDAEKAHRCSPAWTEQ